MAITTDSYYDIIKDGVTLDRIGLSKTLNNYTISEIADYAFVGSYSQCGKQIMPKSQSGWTYVGYSQDHGSCPFSAAFHSGTYDKIDIEDGLTEDYNLTENGIYRKVVLLHDTTGTYPFNLTTASLANMKIITEFDAPKYTMDFGAKSDMLTSESGSHYWRPYEQTSKYNTHLGYNDNELISTCGFQAYIVIEYNSTYYIIMANIINKIFSGELFKATNINNSYMAECANQIVDYQNSNPAGIAETVTQWFSNYDFTGDNPTPIVQNLFADAEYWNDYGGYCSVILFHDKGFRQLFNFTEEYNLLLFIAGCYGIHFIVDGTVYKPIISDNFVTGYTDDLNVASDLDGYTGSTKHDLPVTPPSPTPPVPPTPEGDDFDDHEMGAGSGISGMANLWLLTSSQLNNLHSAFNRAPGGFDPMNSLISVMGLGVAPTYLFSDIEVITPINIRKSDGTSWSTGVEGHIVDAQKSAFQFTGITVNRMYNNFLDYSPYAIHEIFIPMCGWLTLPDIAVDRSITVTYLPDVESLKCRAVVSVVDNSGHRCVIGEKDGIMGADVPFTNTGHSLYVGEAIINGMNVAGEVITGAIGAGFTKTNAKGGTYRPYEGFTVGMGGTLPGAIGNALVSGQTNRTHYMTGNGTRIGFSDGENIQIKSTYHNIDKPNNYDHTVGKVCNKTGQLSEFHGFTVCDNPHINISALEDEKSEIKALLEQGVILPSGE